MQQRRDYRVLVKPHIGGDIRRGDTVGDIGRAVLAQLTGVGKLCHMIGRLYPAHVHIHAAFADFFAQRGKHLIGIKFSVFNV